MTAGFRKSSGTKGYDSGEQKAWKIDQSAAVCRLRSCPGNEARISRMHRYKPPKQSRSLLGKADAVPGIGHILDRTGRHLAERHVLTA